MNPRKNTTVTRGRWGWGTQHPVSDTQSGYALHPSYFYDGTGGKPDIRRVVGSCRDFPLMRRGDLYGMVVSTYEEATAIGLLHGYIKLYGRNTIKFVQSRAARKRGYRPIDSGYYQDVRDHKWREWDVLYPERPWFRVKATSRYHAMKRAVRRMQEEGFSPPDDFWSPTYVVDIEFRRGVRSY